MPFRFESRRAAVSAVLLLIAAAPLWAAPHVQTNQREPTSAEIARAIDIVKADPNLATEKTVRTLKWVHKTDSDPAPPSNLLAWVTDLVGWFAQSARLVVWVAVALLAGLIVIFLLRLVRARTPSAAVNRKPAVTHVQDLDIRPESLPDDIGASCRSLWDEGDHRGALSLLYRGLLSRLVHVHNIPIRDSSTEGDTLELTSGRLSPDKKHYATRLVQVWQRAVYGGSQPETPVLYVLCDEFASTLDVT